MRRANYLLVALLAVSPAAFAVDASTVVGGALGGAAGAAIGQQVGGQNGAILGAAIGGATGAAVGNSASNGQYQSNSRSVGSVQQAVPVRDEGEYEDEHRHHHDNGNHYGERRHHHDSED